MTVVGTPITADNREAWLAHRRHSIGASDAPSVVGLGFDSPIDIWQQKLGLAPPKVENDEMKWGKKLEPLVSQEYRERNGVTLAEQLFVTHPDIPFLTATLDGLTPEGKIVEFKTTSWARDWGDEDTDEVPPPYLIQVQHQMACAGASLADVAVLIRGNTYRQFTVPRNDDLIAALIDRETDFWRCVQLETPPWWGKKDARALALLNPECQGEVVVQDPTLLRDVAAYEAALARQGTAGEEAAELKDRILAALGNHQYAVLPDGRKLKRFLSHVPERMPTRPIKGFVRHYFTILKGDKE